VDRRASIGRQKSDATVETELEVNFPKVVQQHYEGKMFKSKTFVLHIVSVYSGSNIVEMGQHM